MWSATPARARAATRPIPRPPRSPGVAANRSRSSGGRGRRRRPRDDCVGPPTAAQRLVVSVYQTSASIHEPAHVAADALEYPDYCDEPLAGARGSTRRATTSERRCSRPSRSPPSASSASFRASRRWRAANSTPRTSRGGTRRLHARDRRVEPRRDYPRAHPGVGTRGRPRTTRSSAWSSPAPAAGGRSSTTPIAHAHHHGPESTLPATCRLTMRHLLAGAIGVGLSVAPRGIRLPTARSNGGPRALVAARSGTIRKSWVTPPCSSIPTTSTSWAGALDHAAGCWSAEVRRDMQRSRGRQPATSSCSSTRRRVRESHHRPVPRVLVGRHLTVTSSRKPWTFVYSLSDGRPIDITDCATQSSVSHRRGVARRRLPPRSPQPRRRVVDRRSKLPVPRSTSEARAACWNPAHARP